MSKSTYARIARPQQSATFVIMPCLHSSSSNTDLTSGCEDAATWLLKVQSRCVVEKLGRHRLCNSEGQPLVRRRNLGLFDYVRNFANVCAPGTTMMQDKEAQWLHACAYVEDFQSASARRSQLEAFNDQLNLKPLTDRSRTAHARGQVVPL